MYTGGVGTRSLSSAGSCCHSRVHLSTSQRSSRQRRSQGGRPCWALPAPSWGSPEMSCLSRPSQLQHGTRRSSERDKGQCTSKMGLSNTEMVPAMLTVAVPGEADPKVVIFGVVEVPNELHLCPAVERRQLPSSYRQTVVSWIWPRKTLLTVDHEVTVTAVGDPGRVTHPVTGGRCWWWTLYKMT